MKVIFALIISFNIFASVQCNNPNRAQSTEVEMFQLKSYYQLFYDGSFLSCETKCMSEKNCIQQCQKKEAFKSVKAYMEDKHGSKYKKCELWNNFVSQI